MAESWDHNFHHLDAADKFHLKVTNWNKQSFGNIFWQKNCLLARLGGIQWALEGYYSKGLSRLEKKLKVDLKEFLLKKKLFGIKSLEKIGCFSGTVTHLIIITKPSLEGDKKI